MFSLDNAKTEENEENFCVKSHTFSLTIWLVPTKFAKGIFGVIEIELEIQDIRS